MNLQPTTKIIPSTIAQTQAMRRFSYRAALMPPEKESKVVMLDGTLREFSHGLTANHAIEDEPDCIIFDTNKFYVGKYILPLEADFELESGHIYMLLPQSMLNHRLSSVDMERLSVKIKEALLMVAVENKFDRSTSFCGLREMLSGPEIGEKINRREEKTKEVEAWVEEKINKTEEKKGERKQSKCQYVWYLGFASLPIEEEN